MSVARYAVRHGGAAVTHCHVAPQAMLDPLAARNAVDAGHVAAHVAEGHAGASRGTLHVNGRLALRAVIVILLELLLSQHITHIPLSS